MGERAKACVHRRGTDPGTDRQAAVGRVPAAPFSKTRVGTIIRQNKLSTKAKYNAFRRKHPELELPLALEVQVIHSGWSTKPTLAEFNLLSKRQQAAFYKKLHTLPGYAELAM